LVLLNQDAVLEETYDGEDISGRYRVTTVWARRDGRWRLLFEQEVPLSDLSEAGKP
jgi:ketosteroid isomerase-like protein